LPAAALQFALSHPQAASVLIGTASTTSLDRNLDAAVAPWPASAQSLLEP
jgi:D-threo-aldose 1-dehydrogenase